MGTLKKVAMLHIRTFLADGLVIFLIVPYSTTYDKFFTHYIVNVILI